MTDFEALAKTTADVYARRGLQFDDERSKTLFEKPWLDRFLELTPRNPRVLDVGCGAGEPIAAHLIARGAHVTGVDLSSPMLERARARFPGAVWLQADMRRLDLAERFDGIVGWHSVFHLSPDDQRATLARLADRLVEGGALLLTVGPTASETIGHVGGEPVYHASLAPEEYRSILAAHSLSVVSFVPEDPDCDYASVLLAQKSTAAP